MVNVPNFSHVVNIKIRKAKYKMENVKIKKLYNNSKIPIKMHDYDAGFDIMAHLPSDMFCEIEGNKINGIMINPGETVMVGSGISVDIPKGYYLAIYSRSGLSSKRGVGLANSVGIIDCNYHDEIMLPLYNHGTQSQIIRHNDRVAQCMLMPIIDTKFIEVDHFDTEDRGGGLGSTGI